jgi:hypothetical protein
MHGLGEPGKLGERGDLKELGLFEGSAASAMPGGLIGAVRREKDRREKDRREKDRRGRTGGGGPAGAGPAGGGPAEGGRREKTCRRKS